MPVILNNEEEVKLVVYNGTQCIDSQEVSVSAEACCRFFIPSAFSPNNDGINDEFKVLSDVTVELNFFKVYNRFGEVVFETKDKSLGWNGMYKGRTADVGTYYYHAQYKCDSRDKAVKGDCILIR